MYWAAAGVGVYTCPVVGAPLLALLPGAALAGMLAPFRTGRTDWYVSKTAVPWNTDVRPVVLFVLQLCPHAVHLVFAVDPLDPAAFSEA